MAFGYRNFYHGHILNGIDHSIRNHLNTKQVKICYSDPHCTVIHGHSCPESLTANIFKFKAFLHALQEFVNCSQGLLDWPLGEVTLLWHREDLNNGTF